MDTEKCWVIAIPDETVEPWGCRFWDGTAFTKSGRTAVYFHEREKANQVMMELLDTDTAYLKEVNHIVPYQYIQESIKRISQSKYGLHEATDIYVMEAIAKDGRKIFEARIIRSDSPEDVIPDKTPFDPDVVDTRAIIIGEGRTFEEALTLMLRCLNTMNGTPDNDCEEWKKGISDD